MKKRAWKTAVLLVALLVVMAVAGKAAHRAGR